MPRRLTIKDHIRESWLFSRRAITAVVMIAILLSVIIVRLVYLQIINHEHFTTLSRNNRVSIVAIPPTRGLIYDRNGALLAQNLPSFSLELVPERIGDMDKTLQALSELIHISDNDVQRFQKLRRRMRRFESIPLRFRLSDEEVARFAVNRHRFPGVEIEARLARHYPMGQLAAHVVGYVGRIDENDLRSLDYSNYAGTSHVGKVGIERSYEALLHGGVGHQQVETNAQGRTLRVLERTLPRPGNDIYLTLDSRLQAVAEHAFAGRRGALAAIDPLTGEVLALVSMPTYDPDAFVNGIDADDYAALQQSPSQPLFNRALQGQYPPGSTIKPFIGLAGLEYKQAHPEHKVYCPGWYQLSGGEHKYRDWKRGGHGLVNLNTAIAQSCDVYFYELALGLGIDRIHEFLSRFGFGARTGIDIGGELSGVLPSRAWKRQARNEPWFPGETLITGIGQGFNLITPLQLASATATLARRGVHLKPRVLYGVQDPATGQLQIQEPQPLEPVPLSNEGNWDYVINAMMDVVHGLRGTAREIGRNASYKIAGKTGTAQLFGIKQDEEYVAEEVTHKLRDHSLFIAFAPADKPRIALAIVVENAGSGSAVAAPIARQVMDQYLGARPPS